MGHGSGAVAPGSRVRIPDFQADGLPFFEPGGGSELSGRDVLRSNIRDQNTCGDNSDRCLRLSPKLTSTVSAPEDDGSYILCRIVGFPAPGGEVARGSSVRIDIARPCPNLGAPVLTTSRSTTETTTTDPSSSGGSTSSSSSESRGRTGR
ncbi:hypothetical protein GCM10010472_74270 [Pseudonocardia halophobica]|uniref:Uncharacterized protein n=1 Tax=Pseudonocardia halophobica TaxID=29401 RepID=A0A9W6UGE2_9PSEU|nr:hypothetical protein GCM10017577_71820 [Pseudonocardia halophobica]